MTLGLRGPNQENHESSAVENQVGSLAQSSRFAMVGTFWPLRLVRRDGVAAAASRIPRGLHPTLERATLVRCPPPRHPGGLCHVRVELPGLEFCKIPYGDKVLPDLQAKVTL